MTLLQPSTLGRAPVRWDHLNHLGVEPTSQPHYARGVFILLLTSVVYSMIALGCHPYSRVSGHLQVRVHVAEDASETAFIRYRGVDEIVMGSPQNSAYMYIMLFYA